MNVPSPTRVVLLAGLALLLLSMTSVAPVLAQDEEESEHGKLDVGVWYPSLTAGVNLTQSAYSDNWAGGDKGTVNWVLSVDADAKRQINPSLNWSNQLQLAYGQTSTQEPTGGGKSWTRPDKTTDKILFESVGRWTLGVGINFRYRALGYMVDDAIRYALEDGRIEQIYAEYGLTHGTPER